MGTNSANPAGDPNFLAGVAFISANGTTYMLAADAKYVVSSVKRETLTGMDGVHGYKNTPIPGSISARLRDIGSLTVADFNAMTGVTVTLQLANGKTIIGSNMWTVDSQEVDSMEATFDVKWESNSVTEN